MKRLDEATRETIRKRVDELATSEQKRHEIVERVERSLMSTGQTPPPRTEESRFTEQDLLRRPYTV